MTTANEVAAGLIELCRNGRFVEAVERYYAPDVLSVEAVDFGLGLQQRGIEAITAKNVWWEENHQVHGITVNGPFF